MEVLDAPGSGNGYFEPLFPGEGGEGFVPLRVGPRGQGPGGAAVREEALTERTARYVFVHQNHFRGLVAEACEGHQVLVADLEG